MRDRPKVPPIRGGSIDEYLSLLSWSVTGYPPLPARILAFRGLCDKIRLMCKDMP
jgi:hypothetical protein